MQSHGREILGEHYDDEHLSHEEINELGLVVVTENGATVPDEDLRGRIFRISNRDEASGYVVDNMEETGSPAILCYLQRASS